MGIDIDADELAASDRLLVRHPTAQLWVKRVGSRDARRFGPRHESAVKRSPEPPPPPAKLPSA